MQLIITTSFDVTTDIMIPLIKKYTSEDLFRFNTDLYSQYALTFTSSGFSIKDPIGREISSTNISSLYWRKPWMSTPPKQHTLEEFEETQRKYFIREVVNYCKENNVYYFVEPYAEHRVGKIIQMLKAKDYFSVPEWIIACGNAVNQLKPGWVVKTLYSCSAENKAPTVTPWLQDSLSPDFQWFLQREVDAVFDVTVVYAHERCFAFRYPRTQNVTDWRTLISNESLMDWSIFELTKDSIKNIIAFMKTLKLSYGRLDFLQDADGNLHFLEVNPNGQFAWLDLDDKYSMLSWIAQCTAMAPNLV